MGREEPLAGCCYVLSSQLCKKRAIEGEASCELPADNTPNDETGSNTPELSKLADKNESFFVGNSTNLKESRWFAELWERSAVRPDMFTPEDALVLQT